MRPIYRGRNCRKVDKNQSNVFLLLFQITNGDTVLSQELAQQLSKRHMCHVILVKGNNVCNGSTVANPSSQIDAIPSKSAGISILHCDIVNNDDLEKLSQTVQNSFDGIDIVIDNATKGIFSAINSDDCRAFIDVTSEKLRTTINVSGFCFRIHHQNILFWRSLCTLSLLIYLMVFSDVDAFRSKNKILEMWPFRHYSTDYFE